MNQRLAAYLSLVLGIVLVGIWIYIVDFNEVLGSFYKVRLSYAFPLTMCFVLMYFLRSLRWKIILSPIEQITAVESFKLCMTNYFINFLIPVHAGEVVKSLLLKNMKGTPVSKSLLTVYIDKATDVLPVFLLVPLIPFVGSRVASVISVVSGVLLIIFVVFVLCLFLFAYKMDTATIWIEKAFFFLPIAVRLKLRRFLNLFVEGLSSIRKLSNKVFEIIGLALLALIVHCFFMWLFFFSFGIRLPVLTVLVGYLLLNTSFILPAPPGFSGSLELTFVFIFGYLYGYDTNVISAVAASSHILIAMLFGLFGLSAMALIGAKLSTLLRGGTNQEVDLDQS